MHYAMCIPEYVYPPVLSGVPSEGKKDQSYYISIIIINIS